MSIFVCDLGFSSAKCKFGDNLFREFSAYKDVSGQLVVGSEALRGVGSSYLKSTEDLVHRYPAFIQKCLKKADVQAQVPVAVGLPYSFWRDQMAAPGRGAIAALEASIAEIDHVGWVGVYPQGLGGIRKFLEKSPDTTGNILAIDAGFNTLIFNVFNADTGELIYSDTMYKRGVHQMVVEHLKPKISNHVTGGAMTPIEICVLLEKGDIQQGFDFIDIRPEIRQAASEYMGRILEDISGELKSHVGQMVRFDTVIVFGGGAHYIGDGFLQSKTDRLNVVVLDNPEFANAEGFASLAAEDGATA